MADGPIRILQRLDCAANRDFGYVTCVDSRCSIRRLGTSLQALATITRIRMRRHNRHGG